MELSMWKKYSLFLLFLFTPLSVSAQVYQSIPIEIAQCRIGNASGLTPTSIRNDTGGRGGIELRQDSDRIYCDVTCPVNIAQVGGQPYAAFEYFRVKVTSYIPSTPNSSTAVNHAITTRLAFLGTEGSTANSSTFTNLLSCSDLSAATSAATYPVQNVPKVQTINNLTGFFHCQDAVHLPCTGSVQNPDGCRGMPGLLTLSATGLSATNSVVVNSASLEFPIR